jgi:hypothetical protein
MSDRTIAIHISTARLLGAFLVLCALMAAMPVRHAAACVTQSVPAGARQLGFTKLVIDSCPGPQDVSKDGEGTFQWYNGHQWWDDSQQPSPLSYTANIHGQLLLKLGGSMATVTRDMTRGKFPLLSGAKGFYVDFTVQLSDNNPDHFRAVWVMPAEHALGQPDHYAPDPVGYERWFELDVDEGGFTGGFLGTALSWQGKWPTFSRIKNTPIWNVPALDRTKANIFAAAFQPSALKVTWWLNGQMQYTALPMSVAAIARKQNFYLIVTANHHGKHVPYMMKVLRVRAYIPS